MLGPSVGNCSTDGHWQTRSQCVEGCSNLQLSRGHRDTFSDADFEDKHKWVVLFCF